MAGQTQGGFIRSFLNPEGGTERPPASSPVYAGRFHGNTALFIYGSHNCLCYSDKYQAVWFLSKNTTWQTGPATAALVTIRIKLREDGWEKTSEIQMHGESWDYWERKRS